MLGRFSLRCPGHPDRTGLLVRTILALVVLLVTPASLHAEEAASPWFNTEQGRVRLIAAEPSVGSADTVWLGLQFELAPHWKVYWRSPGDAGYPPHLDWAGSENLAGAAVAWPAPGRFTVSGLETMGYEIGRASCRERVEGWGCG